MTVQEILKNIRKLARTSEYQTIYALAKELKIKIFDNDKDLSEPQILFLQHVNFYSGLMLDIYLGEITDIIFKDEIYEDAYVYHKKKEKERQKKSKGEKELNPTKQNPNMKNKVNYVKDRWVFTTPKRR